MTNTAALADEHVAPFETSGGPALAVVPRNGPDGEADGVDVDGVEDVLTLGSFMVRWITILVVITTIGTGLPMWWVTGTFADGAALGAFSGFWIGGGYGMLAGGTRWYEHTQSRPA